MMLKILAAPQAETGLGFWNVIGAARVAVQVITSLMGGLLLRNVKLFV
jgi:hypothetical protein